MITRDTRVEDFMKVPGVITYCIQYGFSPFTCSGEFPGTLGKLLELKNVGDPDSFIAGLNGYVERKADTRET